MFYISLTRRTCNNTFFCTYRNLTAFKTTSELNTTIPIFYTYFTTKVYSIPYIWFPLGISLVNWFWYKFWEIGDIIWHWKGNVILLSVGFLSTQNVFIEAVQLSSISWDKSLLFLGFIKSLRVVLHTLCV